MLWPDIRSFFTGALMRFGTAYTDVGIGFCTGMKDGSCVLPEDRPLKAAIIWSEGRVRSTWR